MTVCRLLFRHGLRRYSSAPNSHLYPPFPYASSAADQQSSFDSHYLTPENPTTTTTVPHHPSNYHYTPQNPTFNHPQNPTFNPTSFNSTPSNHQNSPHHPPAASPANLGDNPQHSNPPSLIPHSPLDFTATPTTLQRSYGFSSAEEAAAERRRRKRRLRIEPPLYALRNPPVTPSSGNPPPPPNSRFPPNPNTPRLPDSTSALVGNRLNLHNRVQSLIRAHDLDGASYVARQSVFQYVRPTVFTCNAIIAAMYRAKRYSDAKALFHYFFKQFDIIPNVVSYNNLIVSHCESGEVDEGLEVYQYILKNAPFSPSYMSYRHLTKGLVDGGRISEAVSLLREMLNKGHGADSLVYDNVISGFLELQDLEKANELFDELKERCTVYDGAVNATFMDWFFRQGRPKEAMYSYRDLMSRGYRMVPATRNVLLETLFKHGKTKEAWDLFQDMLDDHTPPTFQAVNSDTFNMMVNECLKDEKVDEAVSVFKRAGKGVKSKPFQMDVAGFNNMMSRLCELEMLDDAENYYKQLRDKSLSPDVVTYKTLIDAYIKFDKVDAMLEKYSKMVEVGLRVIHPYANVWFGYLVEKGRAYDCVPILKKMADREPKPDATTYEVVIRGLINEGNIDSSTTILGDMISNGVGTTRSLREFLLDAFEKRGQRMVIEDILNKFPSPFFPQRRFMSEQSPRNMGMTWQSSNFSSSPQVNNTQQHQGKDEHSNSSMSETQEQEHPQMAGQSAY